MPNTNISKVTRERAKSLRKNMTPPERKIWLQLKALKSRGYKFRRQAPIGPYIVDFVCFAKNLVVEIDGDTHFLGNEPKKDKQRTIFLEQEGFSLLRFTNLDVANNPEGVLQNVLSGLQKGEPA
ncbi:MAG: endonuclease domain-containing protein [Hyphomicrobiales bacterium]